MVRLKLQVLSEADRDMAVGILMNDQVKQTYMLPDFENEAHAEKLFRRLMALSTDESRFVRGMYVDGELVGFLNDVEIANGAIELGYVVAPAHWGKGFATMALRLAIGELFAKGFREVICGAFAENPASLRVMEKCGMQLLEKTDEIEYRGQVHKCRYRSIQKLTLVKPEVEDLWFKRELLADEQTMSYNLPFGGCMDFPKERWEIWHEKWVGDGDARYFYRYLYSGELGCYVGEIAYHLENGRYLCDVIVMAKYRGRGFGKLWLELLCEEAEKNGVKILYDDILIGNPSVNLFLKNGFTEFSCDEQTVTVCKEL